MQEFCTGPIKWKNFHGILSLLLHLIFSFNWDFEQLANCNDSFWIYIFYDYKLLASVVITHHYHQNMVAVFFLKKKTKHDQFLLTAKRMHFFKKNCLKICFMASLKVIQWETDGVLHICGIYLPRFDCYLRAYIWFLLPLQCPNYLKKVA